MSAPESLPEPTVPRAAPQAVRLLSNGRFASLVTAAGGGYAALDGLAITRWAPDATRDADGPLLYLRDLDTGAVRCAGAQAVAGSGHEDELGTTTEIAVAAGIDAEVRRYRLTNHGATARRIEVTSYAELVLNSPAGDAGHPAFSKLFVQTDWLPEHGALLAWRRLRSPGDPPLWVAHRLIVDGADAGEPEYETDRMRFLGRGRNTADPRALDGDVPLSGTVGNVLDPVFALRRVVEIAPGATADVHWVLAAAASRDGVETALRTLAGARDAAAAVDAAQPPPAGSEEALGLPPTWAAGLRIDDGGVSVTVAPPATRPHAGGSGRGGAGADSSVSAPPPSREPEALRLFNGHGGFAADGSEYVIRVEPGADGRPRLPPLPWVNVIANEEAGFLVSERGAGYSWSANSRENRLTPWSNDPVSDPHGEALYVRDDEDGAFWSPVPGPVPGAGSYEVRHGFGYTVVRHAGRGLEHEVRYFVPRRDPVRVVRVRLTNRGDRARSLSVYSYAHLVLGVLPWETRGRVTTERTERGAVLARNPDRGEFSGRVAFAAAVADAAAEAEFTTDRAAFLGRGGSMEAPAALCSTEPLDGRTGEGLDPCAAFRVRLQLEPGQTAECAFLLGEARDDAFARAVLGRLHDGAAIDRAGAEAGSAWRELLTRVQVQTPSPALDLMVNGWLTYQNLSCRMWGRSAFYQSGGAFGFRDQLQDSSALLHLQPAFTRRQILLHAENQFVEGDVMHWWHPPLGKGMRTRFSDDLLWLPYITAFYLRSTGDASVLDEEARFLTAPLLEPDEDEVFLVPSDSGTRDSVFEHCCRALDRSLTRGAHGLPLMGVGDWNDGMNRVGREGRGESVWLGFFLYDMLADWIGLCERRGDTARAARYREYRRHLADVLNDTGWDGAWYRRAYYDNGAPLGSAENDECRIDTLAQAWAVISGAAPPERAERALDAMEEHLVSEREGLIRLLTPAFDRTPHDPGYIKGYLPGVRENGGQYTHAALWAVRALAEAGRRDRAARLLEMLSPVSHTSTPEGVAVYQAEPYVIAADVYGVAPHVGRGGWTWYTGSAGWMYRVALESVLGLELRGGSALALRPCIPDEWPGYRLSYRLPDGGTTYVIEVERAGAGEANTTATLDGEPAAIEDGAVVVPLARSGGEHHVRVALAADVGPRYRPGPEV